MRPPMPGGARVVAMALRGHGESSADGPSCGMADTAADLFALLDHRGGGPGTVVATSFAPMAALWAIADRPELVGRLVLTSAHLDAAPGWQKALLSLMMRGPLAAGMWASQFAKQPLPK